MKWALLLASLLFSTFTFAQAIAPGTYLGCDASGKDFTLHVAEVPGRIGSFTAILTAKDYGRIYYMDEFDAGTYGLVSMKALDNYVIGSTSSVPVMNLNVTQQQITISPNSFSSKLDISFDSSIIFKQSKAKVLQWVPLMPGLYDKTRSSLSEASSDSREATFSQARIAGRVGNYVLRESRKGLYIVLASELTATGVSLDKNTNLVAFFSVDTGLFSCNRIVLLNTNTGSMQQICRR